MAPRRYRLGKRLTAVAETRRRIEEAVVALHAEQGVLATTTEDIARRADVAVGTVYRHFPSLDDLVRACNLRVAAIARVPAPSIFPPGEPLPARIERLLHELFGVYERAAPWIASGRREGERVAALAAGVRRFDAAIEALVREALRPADPTERTVAVTLALTDFQVWRSLAGRGLATAEAADQVSAVLLAWLHER